MIRSTSVHSRVQSEAHVIVRVQQKHLALSCVELQALLDLDPAQQDTLAAEATAMLTGLQRLSERQRELLAQLSCPTATASGVHPPPDVVRTTPLCSGQPSMFTPGGVRHRCRDGRVGQGPPLYVEHVKVSLGKVLSV